MAWGVSRERQYKRPCIPVPRVVPRTSGVSEIPIRHKVDTGETHPRAVCLPSGVPDDATSPAVELRNRTNTQEPASGNSGQCSLLVRLDDATAPVVRILHEPSQFHFPVCHTLVLVDVLTIVVTDGLRFAVRQLQMTSDQI